MSSRRRSSLEVEQAQIFRARALSVKPERAGARQKGPWACFEPELFTNKNAKIRVQAYFASMEN